MAHAAQRVPNVTGKLLPVGCSSSGEFRDVCCRDAPGLADADHDGLADACEQRIAERYAPVVIHSSDESNFPTSVDAFLNYTTLNFYDDGCTPDLRAPMVPHPTQADLVAASWGASCGRAASVSGDGTRSAGKHRTLFLGDVPAPIRAGSADTRDWTTYYHAYPNELGGVTVQYWRFYSYNDALNDHGGDWEGMHVVLDDSLEVAHLRVLDHSQLRQPPLAWFKFEGTHVRVFSEGGGHATHFSGGAIAAQGCDTAGLLARGRARCVVDLDAPSTFVRQETWSGGEVVSDRGVLGPSGPLVNLGSKRWPMNGQVFVRYSGTWGSPGWFFATSGYWGPAFNETGMRKDGFLSAWCEGMVGEGLGDECYAREATR